MTALPGIGATPAPVCAETGPNELGPAVAPILAKNCRADEHVSTANRSFLHIHTTGRFLVYKILTNGTIAM